MEEIGLIATVISAIAAVMGIPIFARRRKALPSNLSDQQSECACLLTRIRHQGLVRVGYFWYSPFIEEKRMKDGTLQPVGLYPSLMSQVAAKAGLHVEYTKLHISECVDAVRSGRVDIVLSVFQTPRRFREVDFAALLHLVRIGGIVRNDEKRIVTPADLLRDDVRIVVEKGEAGAEHLEAIGVTPGRGHVIQVETDDFSEIVHLVESELADIALVDSVSARRYLLRRPSAPLRRAFPTIPIATCPNGIMLKQEQHALQAWLNQEFRIAREEPQFSIEDDLMLAEWKGIIERFG